MPAMPSVQESPVYSNYYFITKAFIPCFSEIMNRELQLLVDNELRYMKSQMNLTTHLDNFEFALKILNVQNQIVYLSHWNISISLYFLLSSMLVQDLLQVAQGHRRNLSHMPYCHPLDDCWVVACLVWFQNQNEVPTNLHAYILYVGLLLFQLSDVPSATLSFFT